MLVQPVTYLGSAALFGGGCIGVILIGLANTLYLLLSFATAGLFYLLPGAAIYLLMGGLRNLLRIHARWSWVGIPLYLGALVITVIVGVETLAIAFRGTGLLSALGRVVPILGIAFWIVALVGGLMGAFRSPVKESAVPV